jgi:hypothetical protein
MPNIPSANKILNEALKLNPNVNGALSMPRLSGLSCLNIENGAFNS